jgi:hypothetical protein
MHFPLGTIRSIKRLHQQSTITLTGLQWFGKIVLAKILLLTTLGRVSSSSKTWQYLWTRPPWSLQGISENLRCTGTGHPRFCIPVLFSLSGNMTLLRIWPPGPGNRILDEFFPDPDPESRIPDLFDYDKD